MCSNLSNYFDEKHAIKNLNCHIRKIKKIKPHMNEDETFLYQVLVLVGLHLSYM